MDPLDFLDALDLSVTVENTERRGFQDTWDQEELQDSTGHPGHQG